MCVCVCVCMCVCVEPAVYYYRQVLYQLSYRRRGSAVPGVTLWVGVPVWVGVGVGVGVGLPLCAGVGVGGGVPVRPYRHKRGVELNSDRKTTNPMELPAACIGMCATQKETETHLAYQTV